jgi:tryptophanyl-tRNA synthetase
VAYDPVEKPGVSNLLSILSLLTGESVDALVASFEGLQYGALKGAVADAVVAAFAPIRTRTLELLDDPAELDRLLAINAARAEEIAEATLRRVYDAVGFLPRA